MSALLNFLFFFFFFVAQWAFILAWNCFTVETAATNMPQRPVTDSCDVPALTTKDPDSHFWLYSETRLMGSLPFNCHSFTDHHYLMWLISVQQSGARLLFRCLKKGAALCLFSFGEFWSLCGQLCFSKCSNQKKIVHLRGTITSLPSILLQRNCLFLVICNRPVLPGTFAVEQTHTNTSVPQITSWTPVICVKMKTRSRQQFLQLTPTFFPWMGFFS